jgi:hypothetical protein
MRTALLVDGRNMLDPDELRAAGFDYAGIGRGDAGSAEPQGAKEPEPPALERA